MRGRTTSITAALCVLAIGALAVGCGPENGSGPIADANAVWKVQFDLTTPTSLIEDEKPNMSPVFDSGQPDSVTLSWGAAMIRSIRFESDGSGPVDTNITAEDLSRDLSDPDIQLDGPYLLPVTSAARTVGTDVVAPGTYNRMVFVLQPGTSEDDLTGHEYMLGHSLSVSGMAWYEGGARRFTYSTDYASEFAVTGNFNLSEGQTEDFVLLFKANQWFRRGNRWLDPTISANRNTILENIKRSIVARSGVS